MPLKFIWVLVLCEIEVGIIHLVWSWLFMEENIYPFLTKWNVKKKRRLAVGYSFSHGKNLYISISTSFHTSVPTKWSINIDLTEWSLLSPCPLWKPVSQCVALTDTLCLCFSWLLEHFWFSLTLLAVLSGMVIVGLPLFNSAIKKSRSFSVLSMFPCYSYSLFLLDDLNVNCHLSKHTYLQ